MDSRERFTENMGYIYQNLAFIGYGKSFNYGLLKNTLLWTLVSGVCVMFLVLFPCSVIRTQSTVWQGQLNVDTKPEESMLTTSLVFEIMICYPGRELLQCIQCSSCNRFMVCTQPILMKSPLLAKRRTCQMNMGTYNSYLNMKKLTSLA